MYVTIKDFYLSKFSEFVFGQGLCKGLAYKHVISILKLNGMCVPAFCERLSKTLPAEYAFTYIEVYGIFKHRYCRRMAFDLGGQSNKYVNLLQKRRKI